MPTKSKATKKRSTSQTIKKAKTQHPKHFIKVYWPYLPVIALVVGSLIFGSISPAARTNNPATLAYATEMSASSLLAATNQERANNGLGPLTINSKLNSSAQSKANDMVARDYWAHNTPDGQEPWIFFDAAGYQYQKAGENLAYGFATSSATVTGWMNSPSHRANMLDSGYTEVGFGFTNGPNFVSTGNETVVVAHYAKPLNVTPPPPAPAPAPAPTPAQSKPQSLPAQSSNPTPAPAPPAAEQPAPEPALTEDVATPSAEQNNAPASDQPITSDAPVPNKTVSTNITRLQQLTNGKAPWSALVLSGITLAVVVIWLIKHAILVKRFVLHGEHFVAHHPILDVLVVLIALAAVVLSQSSGVVL